MKPERLRHRTWPLVPPAPLTVLAFGVLLAVAFGVLGVTQLRRQGVVSARSRAELFARTLAAKLDVLPLEQRPELLDRAARRASIMVWLADARGHPLAVDTDGQGARGHELIGLVESTLAADLEDRRPRRFGPLRVGGALFSINVQPMSPAPRMASRDTARWIGVAMEIPEPPEGVRELLTALAILTMLLTGVAATVALAVARDVRLDVSDLTRRIHEIATRGRETTDRAQDVVPVQSLDEVGELAAAFNGLVERFAEAEKTYADALANIEELDQERAQFLATVSHELRSPLNAILGFADVLLSEVDGPLEGEAREEVAIIKQSGLHLLELINDILDLSAIASGQLQLSKAEVDIVRIADEVVREAAGARGDKPVTLRIEASDESVRVHADARRVRQIVTNLVGNALKFTSRGEVVVRITSAANESRHVVVRVSDTGPGIAPEEREAIFEEYRQAGDMRSRRRGTGLGLAIAQRLAFMHGGSVGVESEVGKGSTFILRLPTVSSKGWS